jgi:hypothetical protein
LKGRMRARSLMRCTRSGELKGKAAKWRWQPDAMSSEEPRTVSSLGPRGGEEAFMARRVRKVELRSEGSSRAWRARRRCWATRHDELPSSIRKSRREQRDASLTCNAWPANFFINHGISSSPSSSYHRFCSSREFTFRPFFLHIRNYPKVCPDSLNPSNTGDSFAGISSLSSCYLFSPTRDLIALI